MITKLQLVRNVGRFDSVSTTAAHTLGQVSLIYAENGHGKSTLSAILRSLGSGDHEPIIERRRLNAVHPPHIIVACTGAPAPLATFQNGAWSQTLPNIVVFDDQFVEQNVSSGLIVSPGHRHNLHNLILGAQGVALYNQLQGHVTRIEQHNVTLREKLNLIQPHLGVGVDIEKFCKLKEDAAVDKKILDTTSALERSKEEDPIRNTPIISSIQLPEFDIDQISQLFNSGLPDLESLAAAAVHNHISSLGTEGERWLADGMRFQSGRSEGDATICPFCAQDLTRSSIIPHYRAFFGTEYGALKNRIQEGLSRLNRSHGEAVVVAFQRDAATMSERCAFWSKFCDTTVVKVDTAAIVPLWQRIRNQLLELLRQKQGAPLDTIPLPATLSRDIAEFNTYIQAVNDVNVALVPINKRIQEIKTEVLESDPVSLQDRLKELNDIKRRYTAPLEHLCKQYLDEKAAKKVNEKARDTARAQLDQYRQSVFVSYRDAINRYLTKFNAGFKLDKVEPINERSGSFCNYDLVINNQAVSVSAAAQTVGNPSFKSTLSAGDRNTLALSFFFSSLELDQDLADKIVVIDDPVSSLDDHRSRATIEEIQWLSKQVKQVIVLSHTKRFLCQIWKELASGAGKALRLSRIGLDGSTIDEWDIQREMISTHQKRYNALTDYICRGQDDEKIARDLRPHLEHFLHVAFPDAFIGGMMVGNFCDVCRDRLGTGTELLSHADVRELEELNKYSREFHHDSITRGQFAPPNPTELVGYVQRVLTFTRKG